MSSIVIAGDTSGTCTLQAANVAGNTVLNLPTTSGTLVSSGSIPAAGSTTQVQYNNAGAFAGSSNFVFDGTNVGIGTSSPGVKLDVSGGDFRIQQSASTARQRFVAGSNQWNVETSNSTNGYAIYDAAAGQLRFFIDGSGRVTTPAQPAFRAGRLSGVSVADQGVVVFDSATTNIGSNYNTSNGRFTAPVAGMYQFNMQVLFESLSNGNQCEMQFRVNGSDNMAFGPRVKYQADYTGWSGYVSMIGTTSVYLNANDYVQVFNISGGTRSVYGSNPAVWSVFSGFLIG